MKITIKLSYLTAVVLLLSGVCAQAQSDNSNIRVLDSILVKGRVSARDVSSYQSARLPVQDYENPQVTHSVSGRLLADRNYYTQAGMIANVAGVTASWAGISPNYTIRGFRTRSNFRNGLNAYLAYNSEMINIQQIDVVKGPGGTLFGSSNVVFGGLVNSITYKPVDSGFSNVTLAAGNNNFQRAALEVNTVTDAEHNGLFRMFGTYTYKESFQDAGFYRNVFLAPSFSYKVNSRLNVELEAEFMRRISTNSSLITPTTAVENSGSVGLDYKKSYTDNSLQWKTTSINLYGKATYLLSDNWKSETNVMSANGTSDGAYQTNALVKNDTGVARKVLLYNPENIISQQVQQNFTGKFKIGSWKNRLVVGLDYYHYVYVADYNSAGYVDTVSVAHPSSNAYLLTQQKVQNLVAGQLASRTKAETNTYSAYFSDVINPVDALSVMISARVDRLNNLGTLDQNTGLVTGSYNQTAFSPKLGFTYQLIPKTVTVFFNYMNGFQNVAPSGSNGVVYNFKPQYGNQWEGGLKVSAFRRLLDATVSYYDINVSNTVRTDPDDATRYIQDGKQYSRGVELDVQSEPVKGLFVHGGTAYNDSKYTVAAANVKGLRPTDSGPKWSANWYARYQLAYRGNNVWAIGVGGNYTGRDMIINTTAGHFYTDACTLMNGMLSYQNNNFTWSFTADNLLNKHYYYGGRGFITPGTLRQCILSMKVRI